MIHGVFPCSGAIEDLLEFKTLPVTVDGTTSTFVLLGTLPNVKFLSIVVRASVPQGFSSDLKTMVVLKWPNSVQRQ